MQGVDRETGKVSYERLRDWQNRYQADRLIIGSVRTLNAEDLDKINSDPSVLMVTHQTPLPLKLKYETPETLGIDRICLAVGGATLFPGEATLMIDAGTCLTYDLVTSDGQYLGGTIAPGLQMRLKAMHTLTSKLPDLPLDGETPPLGTSTETSMRMGAQTGAALEMDAFIRHYQRQHPKLKVILTGGDAPFFERHIENAIFAAPNLVLQGLHEILLHNATHE